MKLILLLVITLLRGDPPRDAFPGPGADNRDTVVSETTTDREILTEGEDLLYEVRWTMFKLGTVRFKTLKTIHDSASVRYAAVALMDSYGGLPFIDLHAMTYTEMDTLFASRGAQSLEKKKDRWWVLHYILDQGTGRVFVEESWQKDLESPPDSVTMIDTLSVDMTHVEDSFSLAFFARAHAHDTESVTLPLIINGKLGRVQLDFKGDVATDEIDAVDYPIRVLHVRGRLDVEGLFGLTGEFEGWFSDDLARIPVKARLNVILGSVTVELKEWRRKGWKPPR